jgi:hypothetical protein
MTDNDPLARFTEFCQSMANWENSLKERRQNAVGKEAAEARAIMADYEVILKRYCTANVMTEEKRRRVIVQFRSPSTYSHFHIEEMNVGRSVCKISVSDDRDPGWLARTIITMNLVDGEWRVDKMIFDSADGTRPFVIPV